MSLTPNDVPVVDAKKARKYVTVGRAAEGDEYPTSASGKAVYLPKPKHLGEFTCPVSLLRRIDPPEGQEHFGGDLLVPMWFLKQEGITW